jgi:ABC-type xylose transport system substrate-binding protein
VKSIIAGEHFATIYKDTRKLADVTVKMADAVLKGSKPEVNNTKDYDNGTRSSRPTCSTRSWSTRTTTSSRSSTPGITPKTS